MKVWCLDFLTGRLVTSPPQQSFGSLLHSSNWHGSWTLLGTRPPTKLPQTVQIVGSGPDTQLRANQVARRRSPTTKTALQEKPFDFSPKPNAMPAAGWPSFGDRARVRRRHRDNVPGSSLPHGLVD